MENFNDMPKISANTLQNFCRACLHELNQLDKCNILYMDLQIRQWLEDSSIDNLAKDVYSSSICFLCRDKLQELLEFYKMCSRSRKIVMDILEKEKLEKIQVETKVDSNEQKELLEKNQDWLEFDFVVPDKIETTIESVIISKKEYDDVEEVEPLENDILQPFTKEEPEANSIGSFDFLNNAEEVEAEENKYLSESDSDFEINDNDDVSSESEVETKKVINKRTTRKTATEHTGDKEQAPKKTKSTTPATKVKKDKNTSKFTYKFQCDQCNRKCLNQQTLDSHKRTHQGLKPYPCPKCDRSFNKSSHLNNHVNELHAEEKLNIVCEYEGCGKVFHRTGSYKEHYRLKHVQQKAPVAKSEPQHVCEDCGKTYSKLARLKQHQYTHKSKEHYPFHCNECGKAFVRKLAMQEHQLRHAGIKNFECPYCGMKKTTKNELRTHINYHTKERQWPCTKCPMIFNSNGNLRMHDQVVHQGLRRYACRYCDETFGKQDAWKHHEMRHTGEKPHVCAECGKRFIQKVALKAHMKTHNK